MLNDGIEKIRFEGHLVPPNAPRAKVSVVGGFTEDDLTDLHLEVLFLGERDEQDRAVSLILAGPENIRWLENDRLEDGHIELVGLSGFSTSANRPGQESMTFDVSELQRGIHLTREITERKLSVIARLIPSGMITDRLFALKADGTIGSRCFDNHERITFKSQFGELTLQQSFDYRSGSICGDQMTTRIERLVLAGELTVPIGKSLHEVNDALKEELERVRLALAFSFRQPVRLAQINYADQEEGHGTPIYYRRRFRENPTRFKIDELIHSSNLGDGRLGKLVDKIHQQPRSADLARAINFLSVSYTSTLENGFFLAFSAMETVIDIAVSAIGIKKLTRGQWNSLENAVTEAIQKASQDHGFDAADILEKVSELRRPSFRRKVELACDRFNPKVDDIWTGVLYLEGIKEAADLRNGLFHAADYSDNQALQLALIRVRAFTERLLAKILEWPDEDLWVHRDQLLRSMC